MKLFLSILIPLVLTACNTFTRDKETAHLYLQLGTSQLEQGHPALALKSLRQAQKSDPKNAMIQNQLGVTYFMMERYNDSISHFQQAIDLDPNFTDARNNLARSLIEIGNTKLARVQLQLVAQDLTYVGQAKTHLNFGISYFKDQNYLAAIPHFQKSIKLLKDNCISYSYYGRALYEMKDYKAALPVFDSALPLCKREKFDEAHYYAAMAYYKAGDRMKGIALMNETVLLYPDGEYQDRAKNMVDVMKLNKM